MSHKAHLWLFSIALLCLLLPGSSSSSLFSQLFVIYDSSYVSVLEPSLQARRLIYIWNASADVLEVFCQWRVLLRIKMSFWTSLLTGHRFSVSSQGCCKDIAYGNCTACVLTWKLYSVRSYLAYRLSTFYSEVGGRCSVVHVILSA